MLHCPLQTPPSASPPRLRGSARSRDSSTALPSPTPRSTAPRSPARLGTARRSILAQARLWWLAGLALGLGAACQAAPDAQPAGPAPAPLPQAQLRLALTPRTAMVYEPQRVPSPAELADRSVAPVPHALGLEFRTPSASAHGPESVLRLQLSAGAALHLRPRRRGVALSYRVQF